MSEDIYRPRQPKFKLGKTVAKGTREGVWAGVAMWVVVHVAGMLPETFYVNDEIKAWAVAVLAGLLAGGWRALRNAIKHKWGVEIPIINGFALLLIPTFALTGCMTDSQHYLDDTGAEYSRTLAGLGFRIDKDSAGASLIWNAEGGSATIGKETEGIDALTGFEKGLEASGQMLGTLMPFLLLQGQPAPATPGPFATIIESVTQAVLQKLAADGILERME